MIMKNIHHMLLSSVAMGAMLLSSAYAEQTAEKQADAAVANEAEPTKAAAQENMQAKSDEAAEESSESQNPVVAKVGDVSVYKNDLMIIHRNLQEPWNVYDFESLFFTLQDNAIELELGKQYALDKDLDKTEEYAQTLEYYKSVIIYGMAIQQYLDENLTEERLKSYYDDRIKEFEAEEERKIRHILVETEEEAKEIIKQLDEGADFSKLATEKSIGPSGQSGGDLNWATAGEYLPEFSDAAWALEIGKYSAEPVKTNYGYHVMIVDETRLTEPPQYEDVKGLLEGELSRDLREEFFQELAASKEVVRFDMSGKEVVEPVAPEETEPLDDEGIVTEEPAEGADPMAEAPVALEGDMAADVVDVASEAQKTEAKEILNPIDPEKGLEGIKQLSEEKAEEKTEK